MPDTDGFDEDLAWAWCPECECHYPAEYDDCPTCSDPTGESDWDPDDVLGRELERRAERAASDDWYLRLCERCSYPDLGWRD